MIPSDEKEQAIFEQAASVEQAAYDPYASAIAFEQVFKAWSGLSPDSERVKQLTAQLTATLNVYEKILAKQKYIGGNSYSLIDIFHLPYTAMLFNDSIKLGHLITERPHVKAWWEDISNRQTWLDANKLQ